MLDRVRVVVDALRGQHAAEPVVEHDVGDCDEEGDPVLVERQHADHHEEVEVRLDVAARQVDEDRRRGDQAEGRDR